jgi:hypothetical protein
VSTGVYIRVVLSRYSTTVIQRSEVVMRVQAQSLPMLDRIDRKFSKHRYNKYEDVEVENDIIRL